MLSGGGFYRFAGVVGDALTLTGTPVAALAAAVALPVRPVFIHRRALLVGQHGANLVASTAVGPDVAYFGGLFIAQAEGLLQVGHAG